MGGVLISMEQGQKPVRGEGGSTQVLVACRNKGEVA